MQTIFIGSEIEMYFEMSPPYSTCSTIVIEHNMVDDRFVTEAKALVNDKGCFSIGF